MFFFYKLNKTIIYIKKINSYIIQNNNPKSKKVKLRDNQIESESESEAETVPDPQSIDKSSASNISSFQILT